MISSAGAHPAPGSRKRPRSGEAIAPVSRPTPILARTSTRPSLVASVVQPLPNSAKKVPLVMSCLPTRMVIPTTGSINSSKQASVSADGPPQSPDEFLRNMLKKSGVQFQTHSFQTIVDMFAPVRPEEVEAYRLDVLDAIRASDLAKLREFHASGRPLKCSNRFGESILHLACRRAQCNVTEMLLKEASVPLWVIDDFGRTPLTDGCWTPEPNFELMDMLLSHTYTAADGSSRRGTDLLYVSDARGHTPLMYIRREHWKEWNKYLSSKSLEELKPRELAPDKKPLAAEGLKQGN